LPEQLSSLQDWPHSLRVFWKRFAGRRHADHERELSSLIRKAVKELTLQITVEVNTVADYLGVPRFRSLGTLKTVTFVAGLRIEAHRSVRYRLHDEWGDLHQVSVTNISRARKLSGDKLPSAAIVHDGRKNAE
jgi:hypothetical protein